MEERAKVGGAIGEVHVDRADLTCSWVKLDVALVIRRIRRKVQDAAKLESRTASGVRKELVIVMARPIAAHLDAVPPADQARHVFPLVVILLEDPDEAVAGE